MDINRKIAFLVLIDIEKNQAYSNLSLNKQISNNSNEKVNEGFVRELVYGVLENKMYLDYILKCLIPRPISKNRIEITTILRMGIFQILQMNSVPDYAAVDESVKLVNKLFKNQASIVNGVLRNYLRNKSDIVISKEGRSISEYLSIKYSHAKWIIDYWLESFNPEFVEELLLENNTTPLICIRANPLLVTTDDLIQKLEDLNFQIARGELVEEAIYVKGNNLLKEPLFLDGFFSVQDESSMLAVKMLDPKPGETIIDTCAAPGGKSINIAEKMNNQGSVISLDIYEHKLKLIEHAAIKNKISNMTTSLWDSVFLNNDLICRGDKVIVDAPCSGLGVLRRKPELKYKGDLSKVIELSQVQSRILENASKYVVDQGTLIYCTCTISKVENQNVVEKFLLENPQFEKIEEIQLFPNIHHTDGFFICKMIKSIL